ncbi:MAG: peptidoglycan DD-metalloendopeptidase family protein [Oscillibacter sp.]|nr:peptidoglycan DD-metalloendopeptidase family protein [Oscillibacter sp.]
MTLLELSCSGAVLILAAACLRLLTLRRLPKGTFVALWWVAALRLLLPVELPARLSVYTFWESLTRAAPVPEPAVPVTPAQPPVMVLPAPSVGITPTVPATVPVSAPAFPVKTAVYLTVAAALTLAFLASYVRWRRRFRESLPAEGGCVSRWQGLRRQKNPVQVRVSDRIAAPLTYGLVHPVILLPKTMDLSDEEALLCVLTHEEVHIRRLDGLLKLLLTAALCVHWFNPAVWLLYVLANRDMELRCDEAAVRRLGEDRRELYALTLIRMAELQSASVPLCSSFSENGMEERIKAIMSIKKKSWLACLIALALVLGMTTAFATTAKPQDADAPDYEDIVDGELLAASSAETAALWDEVLSPYKPFGLAWTFDDPDLDGNGLTMTFEGHEVRGIFDGRDGSWISEHSGNGTYGPGAVELYAMYDDSGLTGLRLATEEEQAEWTAVREIASAAVEALFESVAYDGGTVSFTIPEGEGRWSLFIRGRVATEDGLGLSVHYLAEESEQAEWVPGRTYSFAVEDARYDELTMEASFEGAEAWSLDLTRFLPEDRQKPLSLPEGRADVPQGDGLLWPVDSDQINNSFGDRAKPGGDGVATHTGVDIGGMEQGTPIYAAGNGTVKESGFNAADGNFVRLDHGNGLETYYAHCRSVLVKTDDAVTRGQNIATVGSTGMSTGAHLHYEVLVNGQSVDPLSYQRQTHSYQIDSTVVGMGKQVGPEEGKSVSICAIQDGLILNAGVRDYGYEEYRGPFVEILYGGTSTMTYFGCDKLLVKTGDKVRAGDVIAWWNNGNLYSYGEGSADDLGSFDAERQKWQTWAAENLVDGGYPRNSRGETYGNHFFEEYLGYEPELMACVSVEGQDGYYWTADTGMTQAGSPEEAMARQNWFEENRVSGYLIPVYDQEHNPIGTFEIGVGNTPSNYRPVTLEELKEAEKNGWPNAKGSAPLEEPLHPFKTMEEAQEAVRNGWPENQGESGTLSALSVQQAAENLARDWLVDGEYPKNKNGQTYAPNESLTCVVGVPPDLVGAVATNGKEGYVSLKDLNKDGTHLYWGLWKSRTDLAAGQSRSLPVYDEAGDVIGEFIMEADKNA